MHRRIAINWHGLFDIAIGWHGRHFVANNWHGLFNAAIVLIAAVGWHVVFRQVCR